MTIVSKDLSSFKMKIAEKDVDFNCKTHGMQKRKIRNYGRGWTKPFCGLCRKDLDEKSRKLQENAQRIIEIENKKKRISELLEKSMIPKRFKDSTFHNYIAKPGAQQKNKSICVDYAKNFLAMLEAGTSLVFCGNVGNGKTHLSAAICNEIIREHQCSAIFMGVIRAVRGVKETFSPLSRVTQQEAINRLVRPSLLVLDEVGVQFGSEAEKLILFEVLNERYQSVKPTILISNLQPKELQNYITSRGVDRLKENGGKVLRFNWESHRGIQ